MTKIALTAAIIFGTASVALASEADPILFNRYPAASVTQTFSAPALQSSNVSLSQGRATVASNYFDRASQSHGGGY